MADATSKPFMITLPSGTKLYGITKTGYIRDGSTIKPNKPTGSEISYFIEVPRDKWDGPSETAIQYAAPGTGAPKFYKEVAAYNVDGSGKWTAYYAAGAELRQELAKYNEGKPTQISTVVATAPKAVAKDANVSLSGLASKLFPKPIDGPTDPPPKDPTQPDSVGGITPEEIKAAGADVVNLSIPAKNTQTAGYMGTHVYPSDLRTNQQDRLKFTLYESLGADISAKAEEIFKPGFSGKIISQRRSRTSLGEVYLPVQPSITDSNNVDWSGTSLNAFESAAFGKSLGLMGKGNVTSAASDIFNSVKEIAKGLASDGGDNPAAQSLKVFLAQEAVGIQGVLSRSTGAVLNPNLELLFNGPMLRPFNFTFRLSPRDKPEADEVRKIIRFFKEAMAVRTASSNVFLKTPNVFDIQFQVGDTNTAHKSLPRVKRCALLSCDVDYTPDGTYMTYNDDAKTLTSYQLSLRFSELDPIYDSDYKDIPRDEIGY